MFKGKNTKLYVTALSMLCAIFCMADEFKPDKHTLLLAHFNDDPYRADYANGTEEFSGAGASLTEGYFGKGVDLRGMQMAKDFRKSDSPNGHFDGFVLPSRDNIRYNQGTFEFWFKVQPMKIKPHYAYGRLTVKSLLSRQVWKPGDRSYKSFLIEITPYAVSYLFPYIPNDYDDGKVSFVATKGYRKKLSPADWHHFALCWDHGAIRGYIDGRLFSCYDMSKHKGLAFASSPVFGIIMNGIVLDELRISDIVRYPETFEPGWLDGKRPAYAYTGVPGLKLYPFKAGHVPTPKLIKPAAYESKYSFQTGNYKMVFDKKNGRLLSLADRHNTASAGANGIMLQQGLDQKSVKPLSASEWQEKNGTVSFTQKFANGVAVENTISGSGKDLIWRITLRNLNPDGELWLEQKLSIPVGFTPDEYFDGTYAKKHLKYPSYNDSYISRLPFVALSNKQYSLGLCLDPHVAYNSFPSAFIPGHNGSALRLGTRLALRGGEKYSYTYRLFEAPADFGVMNALEGFHDRYRDLYRLRPDISIYSYLGTNKHAIGALNIPDHFRQSYIGTLWAWGPGHTKSDEVGSKLFWNNRKFYKDPSYKQALRLEALWKSPENLHEVMNIHPRRSYERFYCTRSYMYYPDMMPNFIMRELWPGYNPTDDPLVMASYYRSEVSKVGNYWINEYKTPLGDSTKKNTVAFWKYSSPYITSIFSNVGHIVGIRHNDKIAQKVPGRAFSADMGNYVLGYMGRQDRYQFIDNNLEIDGFKPGIWSCGGYTSYIECAYSANIGVEDNMKYYMAHVMGKKVFMTARNMLGEKPISFNDMMSGDRMGFFFDPKKIKPEELRDYYRFRSSNRFLNALKIGAYNSALHVQGRLKAYECNPVLVESIVHGRQTHPGGFVDKDLWMVRSGRGVNSFLAIGNMTPNTVTTPVKLLDKYFTGAPLFGMYFGGESSQLMSDGKTELRNVTVKANDLRAFKCLGILDGKPEGTVKIHFTGDGITFRSDCTFDLKKPAVLKLNRFKPVYQIASVDINGKTMAEDLVRGIKLPVGKTRVKVNYRNRVYGFTAGDIAKLDLLKNNSANYCLVADKGFHYINKFVPQVNYQLGFEFGTANMVNDFFRQYDEEDGVFGNLKLGQFYAKAPANYKGWVISIKTGKDQPECRVNIDASKKIIDICGKTQGRARLAMVMFMRILDRKYDHVGRICSLQSGGAPLKNILKKYRIRPETRKFYQNYVEKDFLLKPLLGPEHEKLYANGNLDFTGKYEMRFSPYVLEPTFSDRFKYGYAGSGKVDPGKYKFNRN